MTDVTEIAEKLRAEIDLSGPHATIIVVPVADLRAILDENERLVRAERDANIAKTRLHEEFWEVEKERQLVCLAVKHHANSGTPVSHIVREKMSELGTAEARIAQLEADLVMVRESERAACLKIAEDYAGGEFNPGRIAHHIRERAFLSKGNANG